MADAADFDRQMAAQNARGEEILWHEVPNENILVEGLGFFCRGKAMEPPPPISFRYAAGPAAGADRIVFSHGGCLPALSD